jgi:hypothetical protein
MAAWPILPIERVDQAVLGALGGEVLREEVVQRVIDVTPLLEALRQRQAHRARLAAVVGANNVAAAQQFDRRAIEAKVRERVGQWRQFLTKNIEDGRQLLREVLAGPLRFTPEGRSYRFEGEATLGQIVAGIAGLPTVVASPTGRRQWWRPVFRVLRPDYLRTRSPSSIERSISIGESAPDR